MTERKLAKSISTTCSF